MPSPYYAYFLKFSVCFQLNDNLTGMLSCEFTYNFLQNSCDTWEKVNLSTIASLYQPKTISSNDFLANGKYLVYGANGIIGKYNTFNHELPQIAVACRGASCGALTMTLPKSWITGNAMVVAPKETFPYKEFLFYMLSAKSISYLTSGSAQPQLTRENMGLYTVLMPPIDQIKSFEHKAQNARAVMIANELENLQLISLRDWLLPMLMNGQATIAD